MLGADVSVIEGLGFFLSERQDFLHPWRVGNVAHHLLIGSGAHLLFHFQADGLQVEAELLKDIHRDALTQLDESEQKVFGADEVVVETVGFFPRQREHLLRARREIVHRFLIAHTSKCNYLAGLSNPPSGDAGGGTTGRLTTRNRSRTISARSKSRSSAESFSECCFCKWAGCVRMNNSSTRDRSTPGNDPKSTPRRISDSRFMVSFEEMLWALARIPYARPMWL